MDPGRAKTRDDNLGSQASLPVDRVTCQAGLGSITLESNQLYYITLENSPIILYYNYSIFFKVINYIILLSKM